MHYTGFGISRPTVLTFLYRTEGGSGVISSYHTYASFFSVVTWAQALRNVRYCDITFLVRWW